MPRAPIDPSSRQHGAAPQLFPAEEYAARLEGVHDILQVHGLDAALLTGRAGVAYLTGRVPVEGSPPSACVVTATECIAIVPHGTITDGTALGYAAWNVDGFWQAVASALGEGRAVGVEAEDLTMDQADRFGATLRPRRGLDLSPALRALRMVKSPAEIAVLRALAQVADAGGAAAQAEVRAGLRLSEVAMAAQGAMDAAFARHFPDAEGGGTVSFGAPSLSARRLGTGDILPLTIVAACGGYGATLGRMLVAGVADPARLALWESSVAVHRHGLSLLAPGQTLGGIAAQIDAALAERGLAALQSSTHGHLVGFVPGWEAAAQIQPGNETELEPGMVVALHPTLRVPEGAGVAGVYGAQDLVVITADGHEMLTTCPLTGG